MSGNHIEKNPGYNNGVGSAGIGYITVPDNAELGEYIERCYRTHMVCINGGEGYSMFTGVKIAEDDLCKIEFPTDKSGKGSPVVWVRAGLQNKPVIVKVLPKTDRPGAIRGKQERIRQESSDSAIEVFLDALNNTLSLLAKGSDPAPGRITIKSMGSKEDVIEISASKNVKTEASEIDVQCVNKFYLNINNGEKDIITIVGDEEHLQFTDQWGNDILMNKEVTQAQTGWGQKITMDETHTRVEDQFEHQAEFDEEKAWYKTKFGQELTMNEEQTEYKDQLDKSIVITKDETHYKDGNGNESIWDNEHTQFLCNKFDVGKGKEPMILGDTWKSLMEELISAICTLTVPTPNGPSGTPINSAQFQAVKAKLQTALSKLSNTD